MFRSGCEMSFFSEEKQIFAAVGRKGEREGGGKNAFVFYKILSL